MIKNTDLLDRGKQLNDTMHNIRLTSLIRAFLLGHVFVEQTAIVSGAGCTASEFECCAGTPACININYHLDQRIDCADGSDEHAGISNTLPNRGCCAQSGNFHCKSVCVHSTSILDGVNECHTGNDTGAEDEIKYIGTDCTHTTDVNPSLCCPCSLYVPNSECLDTTGTFLCYCKSGYMEENRGRTCTLRKFGDPCVIDTDCSSAVPNAICHNSVCACKHGWYVVNNVCIQRKITDSCTTDVDCNLAVYQSNCTNGHCACNNGYTANNGNTACTKPSQILLDAAGLAIKCDDENGPACADPFASCMANPVPTEPNAKICACDMDLRHAVKHGGPGVASYCIKQISLGHKCDQGSSHNIVCTDDNTECKAQLNQQFMLNDRCVCSSGWEGTRISDIADQNAIYKCGRRIHGGECTECNKNEGTCYEYYENGVRKVNCHCPGSTSGTNCQTVHAKVKCVGETMTVCYNAHPGYDLSTGSWFEVDGRGKDQPKCRGQVVGTGDAICQPGEAKIEISFSEAGRAVCGTTMSLYDDYWTRFSNDMAAHKSASSHQTDDVVVFTTYCMVQHHAAGSMGAKMEPGIYSRGEVGQSTLAALSLVLEDIHGDHIGNDQPIARADKIKMVLSLDATSGYSRFLVQSCVFSNEANYRRIDAVRKPFITDSCPTAGQTIITNANTFRPMSNTVQETGYFVMKGMPPGQHVYIHCTIKACIFAAECPEAVCTGSGAGRRRRRSADNDTVVKTTDEPEAVKEVDISQSLLLVEPKPSGLSFKEIIAICVILVVVVIVLTVMMVCGVRYWRRRQADNNKLVVPERGYATPTPPHKHQQAAKINPGFVHEQMRSYAS